MTEFDSRQMIVLGMPFVQSLVLGISSQPLPPFVPVPGFKFEDEEEDEDDYRSWWGNGVELIPNT